jgi:predicted nucleotidyltransferase
VELSSKWRGEITFDNTLRDDGMEGMEMDMINRLQMKVPEILARHPVMLAYLYGSAVEGTLTPSSDVDIALVFDPKSGLSSYERMQIEFRIANEIERGCGIREADVRSVDNAPLVVQGMVVSEGIILYSRNEEFRVEYEVQTRKRYFDFLPVAEMMRDSFFEHLRKEGFGHGKTRQG